MAIVACEYCTADEGVESLLCFERDLIGRNVGILFDLSGGFEAFWNFKRNIFGFPPDAS